MDSSESLTTSTETASGRSGYFATNLSSTPLTTSSTNLVFLWAFITTCPSSGLFSSSNVGDEKESSTRSIRSSASMLTSSGIVTIRVHTFLWLWDMTGMSPSYPSISVTVCWAQGHAVMPVTRVPTIFVIGPSRTMVPPARRV